MLVLSLCKITSEMIILEKTHYYNYSDPGLHSTFTQGTHQMYKEAVIRKDEYQSPH